MIVLPFPPSVNAMWRSVNGRNILSKKGREYRQAGAAMVMGQRVTVYGPEARLSVYVAVYPPDNRRRDLDNMLKAPLDLLTNIGVYADDSQIDRLEIVRRQVKPGGAIHVIIEAI